MPAFHLLITARRTIGKLYLPAKNKILFLFSNRFAIHFAIAVISVFSVFTNIAPREVRAEEYGQESVIYAILGQGGPDFIEEIAAGVTPTTPEATSYRESMALSSPLSRDPSIEILTGDMADSGALTTRQTEAVETMVPKRTEVETYTVVEGDTIGTIAGRFGLSITTVLWANDLSVRSTIRPGDTLTILPVDGVVHTVKSGETLSRIASLYNASAEEIESSNNLKSANSLSIGQTLLVPGGERQAPTPTRRVASVSSLFTTGQSTPAGSSERSAIGMIWPTDLRKINTYFGQYYIYGRHWGLDIDCNYTNSNYAALDGIVTKSGWAGAYGNLVEIDHGNGIITRYGHNAKLYVKNGQAVSQGDAVGLCGTTGKSTGTHLHFEVRVHGSAANPLDYIK